MFEFDENTIENASAEAIKDESVEAFDDFEISSEDIQAVESAIEDAEDKAENAGELADELTDEAEELVEEAAGDVAEDIEEPVITEENEFAEEAAEEIIEETEEISDEVDEIAEEAAEEVIEETEENSDEVDEIAEEAAEEAIEETEEISDEVDEIPEEAAEEVIEEPGEISDEVDEIPEEAAEEVIEETDDIPEETADEIAGFITNEDGELTAVPESDVTEDAEDISDDSMEYEELVDESIEEVTGDDDITSAFTDLDSAIDNAEQIDDVVSEGFEFDENFEISGSIPQDTEDTEETAGTEEPDEDDYLDYDDNIPRRKKIVSGKAAVITMLVSGFVTIGIIVCVFWLGVKLQKDTGISVVSYSDRFNACDVNDFSFSEMLNVTPVSFSDEESKLSDHDIKDLKGGKTVAKFDGMVNIKANTRFGKIVSMDISFDKSIDDIPDPSINSLVLLGSSLSGLFDGIDSGTMAFLFSYNSSVISCVKSPEKGENVYYFESDGLVIYTDHSKRLETGKVSDLKVHVENQDTNYIHMDKLDFSWLPFNLSSDDKKDTSVSSNDEVVQTSSEIISGTDTD